MNKHSHIPKLKSDTRKLTRPTLSEKAPTLSYSQLKVEVTSLQTENAELKQKLAKQHNSTFSSKNAVKELQKENIALKKKLDEEESNHKETLSACQGELTSKTAFLETKLRNCEEALENSGINPVTLAVLESDQQQRRNAQATAVENAQILKEKLEENVSSFQSKIQDMEDISRHCQTILKEAQTLST